MKKTITYTENVEQEESITVCDECHREVDEDGVEYHPANYVARGGQTLHFCSECMATMTDGEYTPKSVERVEEWLDSGDRVINTVRFTLKASRGLAILSVAMSLPIFTLISTGRYPTAMVFSFLVATTSTLSFLFNRLVTQSSETKDLLE
jgi:ribosomal protein L37AE/L43A